MHLGYRFVKFALSSSTVEEDCNEEGGGDSDNAGNELKRSQKGS